MLITPSGSSQMRHRTREEYIYFFISFIYQKWLLANEEEEENCLSVWTNLLLISLWHKPKRSCQRLISNKFELTDNDKEYKIKLTRFLKRVLTDPSHPLRSEYVLLPSGRRYRQVKARTERYRLSFIPASIRLWIMVEFQIYFNICTVMLYALWKFVTHYCHQISLISDD